MYLGRGVIINKKLGMENIKKQLMNDLEKLQNECLSIAAIMDEVWVYHPSNPDFINPISYIEYLKGELKRLEREVDEIEREIQLIS